MSIHWTTFKSKMITWGGRLSHKVWPAAVMPGFYATSGLHTHGPYKTARKAMAACEKLDTPDKEVKHVPEVFNRE